ncbi:hypothetical protein WISP_29415 [Willisornis vidua]|uniref:DUF4502 domain-containing protein n=1 Tax=Willisornis vidua TaxID=1566151 RepID=A0ABQ9DKM6_9PASS|nr:hypothetical protein WISP_29415 [Willisornis vidua]
MPGGKSQRPTNKKSRIKKQLGPLLTSTENAAKASAAAESSREAEDIIWTSSGSDFSDGEKKTLSPRLHSKKSHTSKAEELPSRHDLLLKDRSSEDELEFIDWEKDSDSTDRCDGSEKDDSSLEISDSDSCTNINSLPIKEENNELCKKGRTKAALWTKNLYQPKPVVTGGGGIINHNDWIRNLQLVTHLPSVPITLFTDIENIKKFCNITTILPEFVLKVIGLFIRRKKSINLATSTEISEYSSDNDSVGEGETSRATTAPGSTQRLQPRSVVDTGDVTARSASEWLRSAQALLCTPGKQRDKASGAPPESAKKRKLLRGGLAERLCQLQNRERSAISFWRHQCISDTKIPSDKSGVLIVKILEIFEECTIQVAICQQLEQSSAACSPEDAVINAEEPILNVLFTREIAAHLKSRPQDVIHIYPPWVIVTTYFFVIIVGARKEQESQISVSTWMEDLLGILGAVGSSPEDLTVTVQALSAMADEPQELKVKPPSVVMMEVAMPSAADAVRTASNSSLLLWQRDCWVTDCFYAVLILLEQPGMQCTIQVTCDTAVQSRVTSGCTESAAGTDPERQKLLLRNADVPVIMNTYFSQKVLLSEHSEAREKTYGPAKMLIRKNILSLAQTFRLDDLDDELHQESSDNRVAYTPQIHNNCDLKRHPVALRAVNDSLLEMVESQGAVGWSEAQVRVVIQRVYCLPARQGYRSHVQGNKPLCAMPVMNADPPNVRSFSVKIRAHNMLAK